MKLAYLYTVSELTPWKENVNIDTLSFLISQTPVDIKTDVIHFDGFSDEMIHRLSQFDLIFNLCYGYETAGQVEVAAWLDLHNIPHTASTNTSLEIAQNKSLLPDICARLNLLTPFIYNIEDDIDIAAFYISKPRKGSCHRNINIEKGLWFKANKHIFQDDILLQPYIMGREFSVAIIPIHGGKTYDALPPVQIKPSMDCDIYIAGNSFGATYREFTPQISDQLEDELMDAALALHNTIGLKGMSRTDFRVDDNNNIYVLDVNAMPNMDPVKSLMPAICRFNGIEMTELIERMIDNYYYTKQNMSSISSKIKMYF
jgi:D-alanine-D-alanine ligase